MDRGRGDRPGLRLRMRKCLLLSRASACSARCAPSFPAPCQRTDHGRCAHRKRPLRGPARRLHRLPYRPAGRADGRRPGAEDANGYHLLDQHHSRPGDRHRPLQLRRVRPRHAQGGDRRGSESLSGDALPVLRQDQRRRHACAVRLPDARRATRHPGEYAERDELAVQPALGPVAVELGVPRRHAVHPPATRTRRSTAAPTWYRGSVTAAPAILRAASPSRKKP